MSEHLDQALKDSFNQIYHSPKAVRDSYTDTKALVDGVKSGKTVGEKALASVSGGLRMASTLAKSFSNMASLDVGGLTALSHDESTQSQS